jgi:hypothetical protein
VLRARAGAGELLVGEGESIVERLSQIARWRFDEARPTLPLPLDEAQELFPRVVLGASESQAQRTDSAVNLEVVLALTSRQEAAKLMALNGVGALLGMATGVGFRVKNDDVPTMCRVQAFVELAASDDGVAFRVSNRIDRDAPQPLSKKQVVELNRRVVASRPLLVGYYLVAALMGESCRKTSAFSVTREALTKRLTLLECASPPALLDRLAVRMPATFR